jgi:4-hydroxy-3-polyprenylbenzoate decarboxylase/2,5-furandicarboxylate decarboxylase 2
VDDIVGHTVGRVLDLFGVEHAGLVSRWRGMRATLAAVHSDFPTQETP